MTLLGKILVLLNLALSLFLMVWALGVFTQQTDWYTQAPPPDKTKGELYQRRDLILSQKGDGLWADLSAAENRWKFASQVYRGFEPIPAKNRAWFAARMKELAESPNPVLTVTYKDGKLVYDPKNYGLPLMTPAKDKAGQPLNGLDSYVKDYQQTHNLIKLAEDDYSKLVKEDTELTVKLGGEGGLRQQLTQEGDKRQRVLAEQEFLKPVLVNSRIEGDLLLKRQAALEARVKELEGKPVASSR